MGTLRAKERSWHHGNTIGSSVGLLTRRDNDGIDQFVTDLLLEPVQMADVAITYGGCQLDLDRDDPSSTTLDDQVDLVSPAVDAKVADAGP